MKSVPNIRLAPKAIKQEQETICNKIAGQLLIPNFLLHNMFEKDQELTSNMMKNTANLFQVSLFSFLIRSELFLSELIPDNSFYMVSREMRGKFGTGDSKPRCVVCIISDNLKAQGVSLLTTYQHVRNIKLIDRGSKILWSLESFYENSFDKTKLISEILSCPNGTTVELTSSHRRIPRSSYIWTEGIIKLLQ